MKLFKQGYVAPRLEHRYKISTVVITIWLTVTKYPYLNFTFYVDVFFPLSLPILLPDLTVYMSKMVGVLLETGTAYP